KPSVRRTDAAQQRTAVPLLCDPHHAGARLARQLDRSVTGAVVGYQYLADDPGTLQESTRLAHTGRHRLRLIEAWHQNRELRCRRGSTGHDAFRVSRLAKGK